MSTKQVSKERWQEAQREELKIWNNREVKTGWKKWLWPFVRTYYSKKYPFLYARDDWNSWWARELNEYDFLPAHVERFAELGCGPYTNARIILQDRTADEIVCSDPLMPEYLKYKDTWLREGHESGRIKTDAHPAEECPFESDYFDAVVMLNVLDHVQDSDLCLQQAARITRPGGILVIGQDLSDETDISAHEHDPLHPIRLKAEDVQAQLTGFEPIIEKVLSRDEGRAPEDHYATLIFAGRKHGAET